MFIPFIRGVGFQFALILAGIATFCFILPPAVLAFGHGDHAIECLAHADIVNHRTSNAASHIHHDDHSLPSSSHQPGTGCCGLFCMSALPADLDQGLPGVMAGPAPALPAPAHLLSRAPDQPDRPPISLAVL
jgi:hypothetical protein